MCKMNGSLVFLILSNYNLQHNLVGRFLLLRLIEDIDAPAGLVRRVRHIVTSPALVLIRELLDRRNLLLGEFNLLEVLGNSGWGDGLGNDGVATNLTPSQDNLCRGGTLLLSDGLDFRACNEERDVEEVVAEGGVGGDVDVLLLGVGDELLAWEDGVALDLVDGRYKTSLVNQGLQVLDCEVGDTDRAGLALGQLVDRLPCLAVGDRVVDVDFIGVRASGEEVGVRVFAGPEVDGPVDEIQVEVLELELGESVIKRSLNVCGVMLCVP